MARHFGTVVSNTTLNVFFTTAVATGARTDFADVLEDVDIVLVKNGTVTAVTGALNHTRQFNTDAGIYKLAIDLSADAAFTVGSDWTVYGHPDTEQLDSVSVAFIICTFTIETASQKAIRTFNTATFLTDTVASTTGNTNTPQAKVDLSDFVDAQTVADDTAGELWLHQASTGELQYFRVRSMTSPAMLATVEAWPSGANTLNNEVVATDNLWRAGYVDINTVAISDTQQTAGDVTALVTTVDTVVDAVKVKTDSLTFNGSNVHADVKKVNAQAITGDGGSGTEFQGA